MATAYSSEVAIGSYNRIRIKCDYSGTSATLTIQFRRTSGYSTTWRDTAARLIFNGQDKDANYSYTGYVGEDWVTLRPAISGYTISASGGTYSWQFTSPAGGVLACSGTIYVPASGSAPSNGYISNPTSYWDDVKQEIRIGATSGVADGGLALSTFDFCVSERAYGSGVTASVRGIDNPDYAEISNSKKDSGGAVNILPNKNLYLGLMAINSAGTYYFTGPAITTLPGGLQITMTGITANNATIHYTTPADGGAYTKTLEYSVDNGETWHSIGTVSSSSATTGNYQITGLEHGKRYVLKTRVSTTAGTTYSQDVVFYTACPTAVLYGSVSSSARKIIQFAGSVSSKVKHVYKIYGSVDGLSRLIYLIHRS